MIELPKPVDEMNRSIAKTKDLLARLMKGQEYIQKAHADQSIAQIFEAAALFNKIAKELNDELEHAIFMHEVATTGRTVLINRKGRPVNVDEYVKGEVEPVDLWTLKSIQEMTKTFGKEALLEVEFK